MELRVIHHTVDCIGNEVKGDSIEYNKESMQVIAGREAGICYASENYLSDKINNTGAAQKRAVTIVGTGHHSPFDHGSIGLEITGIPKILAMVLNSTEFYTTSEKSARYTVMKPGTQKEEELYNKWRAIFHDKIVELELPNITEKDIDKLALENARYMLSVFTDTSMGYTTTYRQLCYMAKWLDDLHENLCTRKNLFNDRLAPSVKELAEKLHELTGDFVVDNKRGRFQLLPEQYGLGENQVRCEIGNVYEITYMGSLAMLAQAQRHRTIHYEMSLGCKGYDNYGCFVPPILNDSTELANEWKADFNSIAGEFPQCTLVRILEQGRAYWFVKKCAERLCGRAQLEIALRTKATAELFLENRDKLDVDIQSELMEFSDDGKTVHPKCGTTWFNCTEHCRWGEKFGIDRPV